ncbi:MAG: RNA polymerase sigma factor [Saprospiraceae bacterium]
MDNLAIAHLQSRSLGVVRKTVQTFGIPESQAEEILNASTLIFLRKIECGAYQFQGYSPTGYLIEIAKRLCREALRQRQTHIRSHAPDTLPDAPDPDAVRLERQNEAAETLRILLQKMGPPCADVIRLHHIDGYSDEEVITQKLTPYATPDSLKMKRSNCMKKLSQMARQWKNSSNI